MVSSTAKISSKGKATNVPAVTIRGRTVVCHGRWLKTAHVFDEVWLDGTVIDNPPAFVEELKESALDADLFTFSQSLPDTTPNYVYEPEWDNLAVAKTANFDVWWESLPQESRKNTRKAHKKGITVGPVDFSDELVRGIKTIYDEAPFRQGRRFWHYGKSLDAVKAENSSYLDRSQFIGAFLNGDLIGFIKLVYTGDAARIMQILSMNRHYSLHPANALLTAAVECCAKKPVSYLIYGQYIYGNKQSSSVTEFKRRNGFEQVLLPRYTIPLTLKGALAANLRLHRPLAERLPESVHNFLLDTRAKVYSKLPSRSLQAQAVPQSS